MSSFLYLMGTFIAVEENIQKLKTKKHLFDTSLVFVTFNKGHCLKNISFQHHFFSGGVNVLRAAGGLPCSKFIEGSTDSLNPWGAVHLGKVSGLETLLGPTSPRSLCSRLSRDVAYCCPVRLSPSEDRHMMVDSPGASPGLEVKGCQEL